MFVLFMTTLMTGFLDSLNPLAISQQFILQRLTINKKHILFYIMSIFMTNFICGALAYYGFLNPILLYIQNALETYDTLFFYAKAVLLIILSILFFYQMFHLLDNANSSKAMVSKKIRFTKVSPISLIIIGFVTTLSELATALPYFAYLTILFNYQLSFISLCTILFVYNFVYCFPLFCMFVFYIYQGSYFDSFYIRIKKYTNKVTPYLTPLVCLVLISLLLSTFF